MRPYSAPSTIRSRSFPNRLKNSTGARNRVKANRVDTMPTTQKPTPITRLMASRSPLPQYWLMRTEPPLCTPKKNSWMTKVGILTRVTAAMGVSPSRPTMKMSAMPKALVIRFWRIIGVARTATWR